LASNGYFEAGKLTLLPSVSSRQTCWASVQHRTAAVSVMVSAAMPLNKAFNWFPAMQMNGLTAAGTS
jgi:hypothetical protein